MSVGINYLRVLWSGADGGSGSSGYTKRLVISTVVGKKGLRKLWDFKASQDSRIEKGGDMKGDFLEGFKSENNARRSTREEAKLRKESGEIAELEGVRQSPLERNRFRNKNNGVIKYIKRGRKRGKLGGRTLHPS